MVLALGALRLVASTLQTLLPLRPMAGAFGFEVLGNLQTNLQGRRLQSLEDEAANFLIQDLTGQRLAQWFAVVHGHARATVTQPPAIIVVPSRHPQTTASADEQSG